MKGVFPLCVEELSLSRCGCCLVLLGLCVDNGQSERSAWTIPLRSCRRDWKKDKCQVDCWDLSFAPTPTHEKNDRNQRPDNHTDDRRTSAWNCKCQRVSPDTDEQIHGIANVNEPCQRAKLICATIQISSVVVMSPVVASIQLYENHTQFAHNFIITVLYNSERGITWVVVD